MAKGMVILGILMVITVSFLSPVRAFLSCGGPQGDLWDAIMDPLKVLNQLPQFISNGVEDLSLCGSEWKETSQAHVFTLDVPGMKKEEIKIEVKEKNRVITISQEPVEEKGKKGFKWFRAKRGVSKFCRQFRLPGNVDMDKIKADLDNGVLTVTAPKIKRGKTKPPKIVEIFPTGDVTEVEL